jgi:hypothetical protein
MIRSLILIVCAVAALALLMATPASACVLDSDCESATMCLDGVCTRGLNSDNGQDNVPVKRPTGKTCDYDGDCDPGSRCIRGSGPEGVCLGH